MKLVIRGTFRRAPSVPEGRAGTACGKRLPRGVERSSPGHGELDKDSQAPREYGLATVTWASVPRTLLGQAVISNHGNSGILAVSC